MLLASDPEEGVLVLQTQSISAFDRFRDLLRAQGTRAAEGSATCLASDGRYELVYMPFHHVNRAAKLAVVGITPGPTQRDLAYASVQESLHLGLPDEEIFARAKESAAFGGPMRKNLIRMLDHFRLPRMLGVADSADLWGKDAHLLESTSVVPHAAFKGGAMFAGSFQEVMASPVLRACFEADFVLSLGALQPDTLFIALGPTPLAALDWCVQRKLLAAEQVLGAFAHPSAGAGTQIDVYLGARKVEDLHENDPVRRRAPWLRQAYERMNASVGGRLGRVAFDAPRPVEVTEPRATERTIPKKKVVTKIVNAQTEVAGIHAFVSRGPNKGLVLKPHIQDGCYIVSPTRFEADYIRVSLSEPVGKYLAQGLKLRMSCPSFAPSLISPASIRGWR
jgi:hypothetical protein